MTSWTLDTSFYLPTNDDRISFNNVRTMYAENEDGTNLGPRKLSLYYKDGDAVSGTFGSDHFAAGNLAENIPKDGSELRLSNFRGVAKEFNQLVEQGTTSSEGDRISGNNAPVTYEISNTSVNLTYKRIKRWIIGNNISTVYYGQPGVKINCANPKIINIIDLRATLYGGPGKGGSGGSGGAGGARQSSVGSGSTNYNSNGGDGSSGNDGASGSDGTSGGNGGNCLDIVSYPTDTKLYLYKRDVINDIEVFIKPGGGGGGGTGGGGGGGGGVSGGGGGKGAQGYNSSSVTEYEIYTPTTWWRREANSFYNNTYRWWVRWRGTTVYREYEYSYGNGGLSSVVGNDGVTYNKGSVRDNPRFDDDDLTFYENTNTDFRTYFDGGNGGNGGYGGAGGPGVTGPGGKPGMYYWGEEINTTEDHGTATIISSVFESRQPGGAGGGAGDYDCDSGAGGSGGTGGHGYSGGGYTGGGGGGDYGANGTNGGSGHSGQVGGGDVTAPQSGSTNSCGGTGRTLAGSNGSGAGSAGAGGSGGTGGSGGSVLSGSSHVTNGYLIKYNWSQ